MAEENNSGVSPTAQDPPIIKDPQAVLNTLDRLKQEVKELKAQRKIGQNNTVDVEEFQRLKKFEEQYNLEKQVAEEEALRKAGEWEKLTDQKIKTIQTQWENKYSEAEKDRQQKATKIDELTSSLTASNQTIKTLQSRQQALDAFLKNDGRKESFDFVWGGDLVNKVVLDETGSLHLKGTEPETYLKDGEGNEITLDRYFAEFKKTPQGGTFFASKFQGSGSGTSPNTSFGVSSSNDVLTMPKAKLSDRKAMLELEAKVKAKYGNDMSPLAAISKGLVIIE